MLFVRVSNGDYDYHTWIGVWLMFFLFFFIDEDILVCGGIITRKNKMVYYVDSVLHYKPGTDVTKYVTR